jgi:hypothetical protein
MSPDPHKELEAILRDMDRAGAVPRRAAKRIRALVRQIVEGPVRAKNEVTEEQEQ